MAKDWVKKAAKKMKEKGTVGALTAKAKKAGYKNTLTFAYHVMDNKSKYDTKTVQQANFAVNANK